jgi:hypothetical protein
VSDTSDDQRSSQHTPSPYMVVLLEVEGLESSRGGRFWVLFRLVPAHSQSAAHVERVVHLLQRLVGLLVGREREDGKPSAASRAMPGDL